MTSIHDYGFDEGSALMEMEQDAQETNEASLFATVPAEEEAQ